jgi:hypothetical protein
MSDHQINTSSLNRVREPAELYILVFEGANSEVHKEIQTQSSFSLRKRLTENGHNIDDSYPFKGSKECLGILWDKDFSTENMKLFIELQQENR